MQPLLPQNHSLTAPLAESSEQCVAKCSVCPCQLEQGHS